jgi:small subunit ribosomal protein S24e
MEIHITKDERKPLLKRREIIGRIGYEGKTPSRMDVRKELAKKLGAKEELLLVQKIMPEFGNRAAKLEVHIYDDEATMKAVELSFNIKKHFPEAKKEGAEEAKTE